MKKMKPFYSVLHVQLEIICGSTILTSSCVMVDGLVLKKNGVFIFQEGIQDRIQTQKGGCRVLLALISRRIWLGSCFKCLKEAIMVEWIKGMVAVFSLVKSAFSNVVMLWRKTYQDQCLVILGPVKRFKDVKGAHIIEIMLVETRESLFSDRK